MDITITLIIIVITVLISYRGFNRPEFLNLLKHSPFMEVNKNEWYRLISSGFVHADWIHLGVNMYVLYEFGRIVEQCDQGAIRSRACSYEESTFSRFVVGICQN